MCFTFHNLFIFVAIFVNVVKGIPHNHFKQNYLWEYMDEDVVLNLEWVNPCGTEPLSTFNRTELRLRNPRLLKPLRDSIHNYILRLDEPNMNAIDISDISEWFKYNSTYAFLHRINATTEPINLPKRHLETQQYIGAFQYLVIKQKNLDSLHSEATIELYQLLTLAKNLLCEMETVIINARQAMPVVFTREGMDKLLTFRNNNSINKFSGEIDELDKKFTKARFYEYVHSLQHVLNRQRRKRI